MNSEHKLAYSQEQGGGSRLKLYIAVSCNLPVFTQSTPSTSSSPSNYQLPTREIVAVAKEGAQLWGRELAQTLHSIWSGWGQPLLAFMEDADQEQSGALTGVQELPQHVSQQMLIAHYGHFCTSAAPQKAKGCHCWGGCMVEEEGTASEWGEGSH